jgi:hypothetical protein
MWPRQRDLRRLRALDAVAQAQADGHSCQHLQAKVAQDATKKRGKVRTTESCSLQRRSSRSMGMARHTHCTTGQRMQALLPLDMRTKKTRAIRKRLTKEQVNTCQKPLPAANHNAQLPGARVQAPDAPTSCMQANKKTVKASKKAAAFPVRKFALKA